RPPTPTPFPSTTLFRSICESPLTYKALISWRDRLVAGQMLLRDIIDLDATYGGGPEAAKVEADLARGADGQAESEEAGEEEEAEGAEGAEGANGEDAEADEASLSRAARERERGRGAHAKFEEISAP